MSWYEKAANLGEPLAMNNIGHLYQMGQGVPRDYAQAMKWYRQAANAGLPQAMTNIGYLYSKGLGVAKDQAQAHIGIRMPLGAATSERCTTSAASTKPDAV